MTQKPETSKTSSADDTTPRMLERTRIWLVNMQLSGQRLLDRVPPRMRHISRRVFSLAFLVVIGTVLYNQLKGTDWSAVLRSLPTSPWFYLLFLIRFFWLPVTEVLCYSAIWSINLFRHFGAFLLKYILKSSVTGLTGDMYFVVWAVRTLHISYRRAVSAVKDVTLLSAAAANTVAVVVLGGYLLFGDLTLMRSVQPEAVGIIIGVTLGTAFLSLLLIVFRGKVLGVSSRVMWRILGYHVVRSAGAIVLLGLQWTVGLPGVGFTAWISLLIVDLLVARTPALPAREFLFLSLALALADTIDAPEVQVTALFLTDTALRQVVLVSSLIVGLSWRHKSHPLPLDSGNDGPNEPVGLS